MLIREATVYDVPEITALWLAMAAEKGQADPDARAWFDQEARGIEAGMVLCAVAFEGGKAVAFADGSLVYEPGTREHVLIGRHLFVAPEVRGEALGEMVMLRLLALGRQSGASCLITHGTPTQHAVEKYLGKPMQDHAILKIARL